MPRNDRGVVDEFAITSCVADDVYVPNRASDLDEASGELRSRSSDGR